MGLQPTLLFGFILWLILIGTWKYFFISDPLTLIFLLLKTSGHTKALSKIRIFSLTVYMSFAAGIS